MTATTSEPARARAASTGESSRELLMVQLSAPGCRAAREDKAGQRSGGGERAEGRAPSRSARLIPRSIADLRAEERRRFDKARKGEWRWARWA